MSVHIDATHQEGKVSHFIDIGLGFCFMACRKLMFVKKNHEKPQKLPVFGYKIKKTASIKNFETLLPMKSGILSITIGMIKKVTFFNGENHSFCTDRNKLFI